MRPQRRTKYGLTQGQLAAAVQVSTSLIASIENGRLVPQPDTAARLARQAATLDRDPPITLSAIMGEPALRYGDPVLLHRQLEHLLKLSERPSVSIRVVPFSAGIHPGLTGAFAMATQAGRRPVGYLDDQLRGRVVADADDIGALEWTWEALSARALPIEQTRDMIGSLCNACT